MKKLSVFPYGLLTSLAPVDDLDSDTNADTDTTNVDEDTVTDNEDPCVSAVTCKGDYDVSYYGAHTLDDISNCKSIEGSVILKGSVEAPISDLSKLSCLESVSDSMLIGGGIEDLVGLERLESVGELELRALWTENLKGLDGMRQIKGNLIITQNGKLKLIQTLETLDRVSGDLRILFNECLYKEELEKSVQLIPVLGEVDVRNNSVFANDRERCP